MAKGKRNAAAFASLNPDDMLQGGLPTDFRGTIVGASYTKWDYNGNVEEPVLAVKLEIQPADGEDVNQGRVVEQYWSAGSLKDWAPADTDGEEAEEGPCATRVGKRAQMNNNTNFAHLMKSILESGEAAKGKPFTASNLSNEITCLVGLDAHWDRVPQKKRSGMVNLDESEGEEKKKPSNKDILVVTEVYGFDPDGAEATPAPKKAKSKPVVEDDEDEDEAPAPKKATKKPAVEEDDDDEQDEDEAEDDGDDDEDPFDAELAKHVAKAVKAAGGSLKKGKIATAVLKAYASAKPKDKTKAIERCTEEDFLSDAARPWEFDEETGVLSL